MRRAASFAALALYMPRAREKSRLAQSRYCGASATGGPAKGGNSQFGSTFGLCFSGNAGISQGHGNVFASAELCRVFMTQQPGNGDNPGSNIKSAAAAETGEYTNDYHEPAYRASDRRLACSTWSFGSGGKPR